MWMKLQSLQHEFASCRYTKYKLVVVLPSLALFTACQLSLPQSMSIDQVPALGWHSFMGLLWAWLCVQREVCGQRADCSRLTQRLLKVGPANEDKLKIVSSVCTQTEVLLEKVSVLLCFSIAWSANVFYVQSQLEAKDMKLNYESIISQLTERVCELQELSLPRKDLRSNWVEIDFKSVRFQSLQVNQFKLFFCRTVALQL